MRQKALQANFTVLLEKYEIFKSSQGSCYRGLQFSNKAKFSCLVAGDILCNCVNNIAYSYLFLYKLTHYLFTFAVLQTFSKAMHIQGAMACCLAVSLSTL